MSRSDKGVGIVMQPEEGESFWQPMPCNGYAAFKVSPRNCPAGRFSMGFQTIPAGAKVPEHAHDRHEEFIVCLEGTGKAIIDGVEHPIEPGTTIYAGQWVKHSFVNEGEGDLKFVWVITPPGLEDYFETIGRARQPGEPAPEPFPRPADIAEIQTRTAFVPPEPGDD